MSRFIGQIIILIGVLSLAGCSTNKLFTMAIDYERSRANLEIKSIELEFGKITYLDNNVESDATIVLLHGFGGDKDNWNRFSAELDGENRIIIPDLPGHGESISHKDLNYTISHQAKMLSIFMEAIGVNKVHMVGNSMGGAIAISYTDSHPTRVKSLSLIDALGLKKTKSEFDLIIEESDLNPMLNVCTKEAFEKLLHLGMNEPPYIPGFFIDILVSRKCARADIEKSVYNGMIQDSDLSNIVKNIVTPTIIIWGKKDRIIHVDNAQLFHKEIRGSKLVIFEESGHVSLLEIPKKTAKAIEKTISENK